MLADFIPTLPIFHQRGVVTNDEVRALLGLTDENDDTAEDEGQKLWAEIKRLKADLAAERTRSRKEYIRGFDSGVAYAYAFPRSQPPRFTVAPTPTVWPTGTFPVTNAPPVTTGGTVTDHEAGGGKR